VRARVGDEGEDAGTLAQKFIDAVQQLNDDLGIPRHLEALQEADIPALARAACAEGNTYPVPRYMSQEECESLIRRVLPPKAAAAPARRAAPKAAAKTPARKRAATSGRAAKAK